MKKAFIFLGGLVIILAGAFYFMLGSINGFVKTQIEKIGSETLQTSVKVQGVNIDLSEGLGEISGFSVANPTGYKEANAFSFGTVRLDIDPKSLVSSPVVIDEILLDSVSVLYELNAKGKGNLNALLDNIPKGDKASSDKSSDSSASSEDSGDPILISVKKITVKDTGLALDLTALGQKVYDETLPTFYANNVGGAEGLPPAQLGTEIATIMVKNLTREAEKKQKQKLTDKLKDKAKAELEKQLGDKLDGEVGGKLKGLMDKF